MFTEWTGTAWAGVVFATHEQNRIGPILIIVALVIFTALAVIAFFLRRESRERRKRKEQKAQRAAPDQPGGS